MSLNINEEVLTADKTMLSADVLYQFLDCDSADRNVLLHSPITEANFYVKNVGTSGDLTILDELSASMIILSANDVAEVLSSSDEWYLIGADAGNVLVLE